MYLTGTFHPPAGINPLLAAFAFVWHRFVAQRSWPRRWI
jgi:hypothetical protein